VKDRYVTVEISLTGEDQAMLRARAATVGGWEQFSLHTSDGGASVLLKSEANGLFVAPEIARSGDQEGMLRARTETPINWEKFSLVPLDGEDTYALKSVKSGKFVAVEASWTGIYANLLRARSDSVAGRWERFTLAHTDNFRIAGVEPLEPSPLPPD
jgi:hypothetical protein